MSPVPSPESREGDLVRQPLTRTHLDAPAPRMDAADPFEHLNARDPLAPSVDEALRMSAGRTAVHMQRLVDARESAKMSNREAQQGLRRAQDKLRLAERTIGLLQQQLALSETRNTTSVDALQAMIALWDGVDLSDLPDDVRAALAQAHTALRSPSPGPTEGGGTR